MTNPGHPEHAGAVRLYEPEVLDDPAAFLEKLRRERGPVVPVLLDADLPAWLVLGYRELHHVTSQPQLFARDPRRWNQLDRVPPDWPARPHVTHQPTLVFTEGEERRRRGGAIGDALDEIDRIELTQLCEKVADANVDLFSGDGEADLVSQYAHRMPAQVIARLFGLPEPDVGTLLRAIFQAMNDPATRDEAEMQVGELMGRLVAGKRVRPGQDLASRLVTHDARLTDPEVVYDMLSLLIASQENCAGWIGNTLRLMLVDDHFQMDLQGGRSSVAEALNQVLWKDPPAQNLPSRYAAQDCELAGRRIRRGDMIVISLVGANADPQVRQGHAMANRAHLAFGHGEYSCPFPAPELAEIISKTAVEVLLDRLPDVRLAVAPEELRWRRNIWNRMLSALPVVFTPAMGR
ncbi:cytochrome P450 [Nonomuraea sp. MCN248]|uniref:Cytochrome P450 n=1 Tax=Nonomuraea corallina TaxID=2989783 RepID=A0ABT4SCT3_9ACTN|nr:cytochrome P450 [Nonomuraea corallina]MDA0634770.1 cytochrome P450 [Nonomuraea corallina]